MHKSFIGTLASAALLALVVPAIAAIPPAPVAKQVPVVDNYFGTTVTDPYRWMEQSNNPDLQAYLKAQNDRTRAILDAIPGRKGILDRVTALFSTVTSSSNVARRGSLFFYQKLASGAQLDKLYVRDGIGGAERVLVDPATFARRGGPQAALAYYFPSNDGKLVAYGIALGGSENATIHVIETATGHRLPDEIDRARFGITSWRQDGKAFYYVRTQLVPPGSPPAAAYQNVRTYLHVVGTDAETDKPIFGAGVSPSAAIAPNQFAFAFVSPNSPYAIGVVQNGVQRQVGIFAAPKNQIDGGQANWRKVVDPSDGIVDEALHGGDLYVLSLKDAPRAQVLQVRLAQPDIASAPVAIPASSRVLVSLAAARDALYVQSLENGLGRITRLDWSGDRSEVDLPVNGTVSDLSTEPDADGFMAKLESWTVSPLWYAFDPATKKVTDTGIDPPSPVDFSNVVAEEVTVKARDGVMVPLSIIHRKDMKKDGSNPLLLNAYGSYGINLTPAFSAVRLAWLERGGVSAIAHVRGGGELGEDWHLAGKGANKINTVNDFIDCAKWLVDQKYTSPGKLAGIGGSAGGIPMGGAIAHAPELFAAIIDEVPVSDQLRMEFSANGPPNVPEFGSVKTEQGFKNLYATSPVQNLKPGGKYPAVMLTAGVNDPRVDAWEPAKMTATLQADSASGKPILLRVDFSGGHGYGDTTAQRLEEIADDYAFLLWNMGVPGFQPTI